MQHRILIAALSALMLIGTASPAVAKGPEIGLKTKKIATIVAGDSAWVAINWQAKNGDVTDFRVVADAPGDVQVTYPENTPGFTGLMNGHVLSDKEMDFTALKLSVPYSQTTKFKITLTVAYSIDGVPAQDSFNVTVPVATYQADRDLAQVTDSAGSVAGGEAAWVEVSFTGLAPKIEGFDLVVAETTGFIVSYPEPGSSTSLFHDTTLEDGETDYAAFRIDTFGVAPGTYSIPLRIAYTMAGASRTLDATVSVQVTG